MIFGKPLNFFVILAAVLAATLCFGTASAVLGVGSRIAVIAATTSGNSVVQDEIRERNKQIEELQRQIEEYQIQADSSRTKSKTLENEIARLNAEINQVQLEIRSLNLSTRQARR